MRFQNVVVEFFADDVLHHKVITEEPERRIHRVEQYLVEGEGTRLSSC